MNKTKISFGPLIIVLVAFGIPLYMINKYGFMEYAQKKLENRMENRQKLASAIGL
jgi:hypothetical protein